jgi:hypothetical protein
MNKNTTIAFVGGSIPSGAGFKDAAQSTEIYPQIIAKHLTATVINLGIDGGNNYEIFMSACKCFLDSSIDIIVVEWNTFQRYRFYPTPNSPVFVSSRETTETYTNNRVPLSKNDLGNLQKLMLLCNHDYHHILTLVDYCNILVKLASNEKKLILLNGHIPWTTDLLKTYEKTSNLFDELSEYTKSVIEFNTTSDNEMQQLLSTLTACVQSLDQHYWPNMFNSLTKQKIDVLADGEHPGPKSHALYADMIIKHLESNNGN